MHNKIKCNQYSADEINTLKRVVISIVIAIHTCYFYCLKLLIKECKDRENIHFLFAFSAHFKKNEVSLSFKQINNYRTHKNKDTQMKKVITSFCLVLALSVMTMTLFAQQGKFRGTVKYTMKWEGDVPQGASTEFSIKVFDQQESFTFSMPTLTNAESRTAYALIDFSQVPLEGVTGKWYIKSKIKDEDLKNVTYEVTNETKTIAGKTCKKVNVTFKEDDGTEKKESIWMCDAMGPKEDLNFYPGLKGMPFEFPIEAEKYKITFTVSEIVEGKVSEADMLLPTGYEEITTDDFKEMMTEIQKAYGKGGGSDDDI